MRLKKKKIVRKINVYFSRIFTKPEPHFHDCLCNILWVFNSEGSRFLLVREASTRETVDNDGFEVTYNDKCEFS